MHNLDDFAKNFSALLKTSGDSGDSGDRLENEPVFNSLAVTTREQEVSPVENRVVTGIKTSGDAFVTSSQQLSEGVTTVTTVTTHFGRGATGVTGTALDLHQLHIPKAWIDGFERLRAAEPLSDFTSDAWGQMLHDGFAFLSIWGEQAARLGWRDLDLFGLHPIKPLSRVGCQGLAFLLHGGAVTAITERGAALRKETGVMQSFRRPVYAEQVLAWELLR